MQNKAKCVDNKHRWQCPLRHDTVSEAEEGTVHPSQPTVPMCSTTCVSSKTEEAKRRFLSDRRLRIEINLITHLE